MKKIFWTNFINKRYFKIANKDASNRAKWNFFKTIKIKVRGVTPGQKKKCSQQKVNKNKHNFKRPLIDKQLAIGSIVFGQ